MKRRKKKTRLIILRRLGQVTNLVMKIFNLNHQMKLQLSLKLLLRVVLVEQKDLMMALD